MFRHNGDDIMRYPIQSGIFGGARSGRSLLLIAKILRFCVLAAALNSAAQTTDPRPISLPAQPTGPALHGRVHRTVSEKGTRVPPLSTGEKFQLFAQSTFHPFAALSVTAQAAISQARDSNPKYGQGWEAYGKRVGAFAANRASSDFFSLAVLPSLLKQDPRFFRSGKGSGGTRVGYAVSRVVVTRTDSGRETFNTSRVLGTFMSAGLSNAYYPRESRTVGQTFGHAWQSLAMSAVYNVLREFGPDVKRKLLRRHD